MRQQPPRGRRGNTFMIVGLTMPVLIGFMAMGVDWGGVAVARYQVQSAADEGAMAAASAIIVTPKTTGAVSSAMTLARTRANQYANLMYFNSVTPSVNTSDVEFGHVADGVWYEYSLPDEEYPNAVKVTAQATVPMPFLGLFGMNSVLVKSTAKAAPNVLAARAPDVALVQDVTPSMRSADIANSMDANTLLINCVHEKADPSTRVGYVKFSTLPDAKIPLDSYANHFSSSPTIAEKLGTMSYYCSAGINGSDKCIDSLCTNTSGCTNHAAGMAGGLKMLRDAQSDLPPDVGQVVIFVTDGELSSQGTGTECGSTTLSHSISSQFKDTYLPAQCATLDSYNDAQTCEYNGAKFQGCRLTGTSVDTATECTTLGHFWSSKQNVCFAKASGQANSAACTALTTSTVGVCSGGSDGNHSNVAASCVDHCSGGTPVYGTAADGFAVLSTSGTCRPSSGTHKRSGAGAHNHTWNDHTWTPNLTGNWNTVTCSPTDNGDVSGYCLGATSNTSELSCEHANGTWVRSATDSTPNPSTLTQWVNDKRNQAAGGASFEPIDIYAIFYSEATTDATARARNKTFLNKHVVYGKGATAGAFDTSSGQTLDQIMEAICISYTSGTVGLIED